MNRLATLLSFAFLVTASVPVFADFPVRQGTSYEHRPRVAYNSTDHEYLVVWNEWTPMGSGMYLAIGPVVGQRIAEDGTKLGNVFTIFSSGSEPAVVYNSGNNEYLLAASVLMGGTTVQRVTAGGSLTGSAVQVATGMSNLHLVFNSLAGNYLLAGQEWVSAENLYHINTYRISASGQLLSTNSTVDKTSDENGFGLAYGPVSSSETPTGRYLLVLAGGGGDITLVMLDSDGKPIDVVTDPYHPGVKYRYIPFDAGNIGGVHGFDVTYGLQSGYSMTGPAFFIVWADENNVYVDADGQHCVGIWGSFVPTKIDYLTTDSKKDNSFLISWIMYHWAYESHVSTWNPVVAYNPAGEKYMVAWRETPGTEPENDTKVNHIRANTAFDKIPPKLNTVLSAINGNENPRYPAIASSTVEASALVVWEDCRDSSSTDWDLFGTIYSIAAVPPPPPPPPKTNYVVTNTNDDGDGSLRKAITDANAHTGLDTISFNIPGTDLHTIQPASELPAITDPVLIDGYTQPGSSVNTNAFSSGTNAVLKVEIDGTNTGTDGTGLRIHGGNSTVRGLLVNRCKKAGLMLEQKGNNVITGNFLGTDGTGANPLGNGAGILIEGVADNIIGGTAQAARNLIAGNEMQNVHIHGAAASRNHVEGNYIGTNAAGTMRVAKTSHGVEIDDGSENVIGGTAGSAGNVITGHGEQSVGLFVRGYGISIFGSSSRDNIIQGNLIGVNAAGNAAVENVQDGISITGSSHNTIGGTSQGARNIVAGNKYFGIYLQSDSNLIQGNFIGTDIGGTKAIANDMGILINGNAGNIIGGSAGAGNVISGNTTQGIQIISGGTPGNRVQGNLIGLQSDGASPLGNTGAGVEVFSASFDNLIGGAGNGLGNTIACNGGDGIKLRDPSVRTRIERNSIFGNIGMGINLVGGSEDSKGVTANDPGDGDAGANTLQNYPVFTSLEGGDFAFATGSLNSIPNTAFRIQFFMNSSNDPLSPGQGRTYMGETDVTTDASGNVSFSTTIGTPFPVGNTLTATATDPQGNTSEFSASIVATAVVPTVTRWVVTSTDDAGTGSLRWAIEGTNGRQGWDTVAFSIPGTGVHTIQPQTPLPEITDNVLIDGFSQPGSSPNTNDFRHGSNAALMIEIDGTNAGATACGLRIDAGHCRVRGLAINSFGGDGIRLAFENGNIIEGCFVGTDPTGTVRDGNNRGVYVYHSWDNKIGGTDPHVCNVISGNNHHGILVQESQGNLIEGNYIGADATGRTGLANDSAGVLLYNTSHNTIGGTPEGAGNVITGKYNGVVIRYAQDNVIEGNLIGTNAAGDTAIGEQEEAGILLQFANHNAVGGTAAGSRNIIAGCVGSGILLAGADSNLIAGNYVGTEITGTKQLGNGIGVLIVESCDNRVGGRENGSRNIISGNKHEGLQMFDYNRGHNNAVQGNYVGTQADGQTPLGNGGHGILSYDCSMDSIGGAEGAANTIAYNGAHGVAIGDPDTRSITVSRNSIFGNAELGINIMGGVENAKGVTANDVNDADTGPNNCQNYPVITSIGLGATTTVNGSLNSSANSIYTLEFFMTAGDNPLSDGEGQTYIGEQQVATDGNGNVDFAATFPVVLPAGNGITVTATCPFGNTSEFSAPMVPTDVTEGVMAGIPTETALLQNYPNPFNPSTEIRYDLAKGAEVELTLFDLLGRKVRILVHGHKPAGRYFQMLDASDLASGIYLYRLVAGSYVGVRRMIVLK